MRFITLALIFWASPGCKGKKDKASADKAGEAAAPAEAVPTALAVPPVPVDAHPAQSRVIVLGLSGMDPDWVDRWRRDLPNLDALLAGKVTWRLQTTLPPHSATAWTSMLTGRGPGAHGVLGFFRRDPTTYRPIPALAAVEEASFGADGAVLAPPRGATPPPETPFWDVAASRGMRVKVLFAPWRWPPPQTQGVELLAGEGLPDLRLTNSTFTLYGSDLTPTQEAEDTPGGDLVALTGGRPWRAAISGPSGRDGAPVTVPLQVRVSGADAVELVVGAQDLSVKVGAFSDWITVPFPVGPGTVVSGRVRFFPLEVGDRVRLYMTPVISDAEAPWLALSSPAGWSRELRKTYAEWKGIGWAYDTAALSSGLVPEAVFVMDLRDTMLRRAQVLLGELDRQDAELYVGFLSGIDAASYLFMRLSDPTHPAYDADLARTYGSVLKDTYVEVDRVVGEVRKRMHPGDTLLVVSESGFASWRREVNLNTWLVQNGLLTLAPGLDRSDLNEVSLEGIDWRRSVAYALGTGEIYLNLKGREAQGVVPPARRQKQAEEIAQKLHLLKDDGNPVVKSATLVASRDALGDGPDLLVTFYDGYQSSRATALGRVPISVLEDNLRRWSGDRASSDPADVPGFVATTLTPLPEAMGVLDVGPTALSLLGITPPAGLEGKSWVSVQARPTP